jgi:hypothetical protein
MIRDHKNKIFEEEVHWRDTVAGYEGDEERERVRTDTIFAYMNQRNEDLIFDVANLRTELENFKMECYKVWLLILFSKTNFFL